MKIFRILLVLNCVFPSVFYGQNYVLDWVKQMGGYGTDIGERINIDSDGNIYTVGRFMHTTDFDPGSGISEFESEGSYDVFIQKLDSNGNYIWCKTIGGSTWDYVSDIKFDDIGNIYVVGSFGETADLNPSAGSSLYTSNGENDVFVMKLNVTGDLLWLKHYGGAGHDVATDIELDDNNNIYITGTFQNTVDFNPNAGVNSFTAQGLRDSYILKLTSDGQFTWAKHLKSNGGNAYVTSFGIAIDNNGYLYTVGSFNNTVELEPDSGMYSFYAEHVDGFIQKLDTDGAILWAKQYTGSQVEYPIKITNDDNGDLLVTGVFMDSVDFDLGPGENYMFSGDFSIDVFIQKLTTNGDFIWVNHLEGGSRDVPNAIVTDPDGNVYITGEFKDNLQAELESGVQNIISEGFNDIFIYGVDIDGNSIWLKGLGGASDDIGYDIVIDDSKNLYITGMFNQVVDFDPNSGVYNLTSEGVGSDVFIQKLKSINEPVGLVDEQINTDFVVYPNPNSGQFFVKFNSPKSKIYIQVYSVLGQEILNQTYHNSSVIPVEFTGNKGIYMMKVSDADGNEFVIKVIKE